MLSKRAASLETYIKNHGEDEGQRRWKIYLKKRAQAYAKRHEDGYQFKKYNKEYFINLYGEEKGNAVYLTRNKKISRNNSLERYIEEFGPELGRKICKEIKDNFSLNYFIKKYGVKQGPIEYEKAIHKRLESFPNHYSKIGTDFFEKLTNILKISAFYGKNEKKFCLTVEERMLLPQKIISVDFYYKGKIIEYKGNTIHANPMMFESTSKPHPWQKNLTAKEIWKKDSDREKILIDRGYKLISVWEKEYKEDPESTLARCIEFLEED